MTLHDLMLLEGIDNYNVWWYGKDIYQDYMNDEGLTKDVIDLKRGVNLKGRIYLVLAGITGTKCRYRFAIKLVEQVGENLYTWERVPLNIDLYAGRLVFKHNYKFSFYNSTGKEFVVDEIWPSEGNRTIEKFRDYDSVDFTFDQLQEVISNQYSDYYEHFICVKAVYMIIDGNTGKQYIGSAYENNESLWARWRTYSETYHGGNKKLRELYKKHGEEYFKQFKYIILHIFPMKVSDKEIIEAESRYKERFMTRQFGLNAN
ncbi:GIY-YIG nuclease family protein [Butyrivibrio fibrisolvens]|uniref:GIY-YIG nuclease family protein n=1 Tax=Pseudobutyrivibrio ruminis TaxID=46206 RepID=UPI0004131CD3|nr:GIY-YIG nuclease family protein [Pseudobutyrivibrio ruminis]MDC7280765.1 GIY-YIG nuclease family protein [Butyrivibrio fibrisolvens]